MRCVKRAVVFAVFLCMILPVGVYAANAGDGFTTCDINGTETGTVFTTAAINILNTVDTSGNYNLYGVDVGIFKKPASGNSWTPIFTKRVESPGAQIQITDFGNMSLYEYNTVYSIGYRLLYEMVDSESNEIIDTTWGQPSNSYFKVKPPIRAEITEFTDMVTAANEWMYEAIKKGTMTEQEIIQKGYNKYFDPSEVVCRFVITPKPGVTVDRYRIDLDMNDNSDIEIEYVKIVKTQIEGQAAVTNENPGIRQSSNDKITNFIINNPGNKKVTVYCKYKFKKKDTKKTVNPFINRVTVTPVVGGKNTAIREKANTIYLRNSRINYM